MLVKILDNGQAVYPYSFSQLRQDNPHSSFPPAPSAETLAGFNVFPVESTEPPAPADEVVISEGAPAFVNGGWVQTWVTEPASPELIAERLAGRRAGMVVTARQMRLALAGAGLLSTVTTTINGIANEATKITWEYATEFHRNDPLVATFGSLLEQDDAAIDRLFDLAKTL